MFKGLRGLPINDANLYIRDPIVETTGLRG